MTQTRTAGWLSTLASISRLHIVAIAALGTLTFGWIFTGARPWGLAAVVALDWFVVNLLNRVVDLEEDTTNRIVGTAFVARHKRGVLVVGLGAMALSFPLFHLLWPAITPWRIGYHLLGTAYNWPLLPWVGRIKTLYFWKNTASAVGFLITVFIYPLVVAADEGVALADGITWPIIGWTVAFFLLFELSYEVVYDLRDAEGDRAAGVHSYAAVHGERTAGTIANGLMLASVVVAVIGWTVGPLPWRIFIMVAAPLMQLFLVRRFRRAGLSSAHCIGLTWLGAGLLATYHLWVELGLPGVDL
ncbi:MAG: UbiA family prenyltransferase [Deltaproteobacteria bacterium]|nr:UbiA family prenyltransferase [Deltaproteobacteria bacterium]